MLTVALATVRTRLGAFAGTFAALALGVSVIAMMALVLAAASAGDPHERPERFAAVPYVIHVDPSLRIRDRNGSRRLGSAPGAARRAALGHRRVAGHHRGPQLLRPGRGHGGNTARPRARLVIGGVRALRAHRRPPAPLGRRDCRRRPRGHRQPGRGAHRSRVTDVHDRRHRPAADRGAAGLLHRRGGSPAIAGSRRAGDRRCRDGGPRGRAARRAAGGAHRRRPARGRSGSGAGRHRPDRADHLPRRRRHAFRLRRR